MKKRVLSLILAAVMMCGLCPAGRAILPWQEKVGFADNTMVATPTDQRINIDNTTGVNQNIPIYTITQANGYGANYIRLRDVCYYLDMDVVWNAENPNAMYIYTHRHYLDAWDTAGPATTVKTAVASNMEIYINDEKVTSDSQPVLIENNNYFKIRDLAKLLDVGCVYGAANSQKGYVSAVRLDSDYPYTDNEVNVDEQGIPQGQFNINNYLRKKYPDSKREEKVYESSVWYGGDSGTLSDTPVTYSARDAWAKEDYWNSEENKEYREYWVKELAAKGKTPETYQYTSKEITFFNSVVQLILDAPIIESDQSGKNGSNPYYYYPKNDSSSVDCMYANMTAGLTNLPELDNIDGIKYGGNTAQLSASIYRSGDAEVNQYLMNHTKLYAADIIATANSFATDREKVTYLAQQICDRMTYVGLPEYNTLQASEGTVRYDKYTIWQDRSKICSGACLSYSDAFSVLAAACDLYVVSYAYAAEGSNDPNHARNAVYLEDEGVWVAVDCTWADSPQSYMIGTEYDDEYICFEEKADIAQFSLSAAAVTCAGKIKNR